MKATAERTPLPPIRKTVMLPGRSGRLECWGARTCDNQWGFDRTEEEGGNTPWEIFHLTSVKDGSYTLPVTISSTRKGCQLIVASGLAAAMLAVAKCPHPLDQRGHRVDHGTWDWHYDTCAACRGVRPVHDGDDRCRTCQEAEDGTGPGHEWGADR